MKSEILLLKNYATAMSNDYDDYKRGKTLRDTLNLAVDGHSDSENRTWSKEFYTLQ